MRKILFSYFLKEQIKVKKFRAALGSGKSVSTFESARITEFWGTFLDLWMRFVLSELFRTIIAVQANNQ